MRAWLVIGVIGSLVGCEQRQDFASATDGGVDGGVDAAPDVTHDATVVGLDGGRACSPAPLDGGPPLPVVAVWEGYFEDALPGGADALKIVLRSSNGVDLAGTVVFGSAPPPASPANSNECYPTGWDWAQGMASAPDYPIEGHEYPVMSATSSAIRLQVAVSKFAPWTDWCSCQIPVQASPEGGWACQPNLPGHGTEDGRCFMDDFEAGTSVEFPCCRRVLCLGQMACQCDAERCTVSTDTVASFDLSVNGDRADGTVEGPLFVGGVHLLRKQ